MLQKLLQIRYIYIVTVGFTILNSVVFMILGIIHCIKGYVSLVKELQGNHAETPGLELLQGLDMFLISLVFLIFGLGILKIFTHYHNKEENLPNWLKIENFSELKILLWETMLITLVVFTMSNIAIRSRDLTWDALILPAVILTLTVSLYLVKAKNH